MDKVFLLPATYGVKGRYGGFLPLVEMTCLSSYHKNQRPAIFEVTLATKGIFMDNDIVGTVKLVIPGGYPTQC